MDLISKSHGSLKFSIVFGKTLSVEHWRRKESQCLVATLNFLKAHRFGSRPKPVFNSH